jgi:hypothetical protein
MLAHDLFTTGTSLLRSYAVEKRIDSGDGIFPTVGYLAVLGVIWFAWCGIRVLEHANYGTTKYSGVLDITKARLSAQKLLAKQNFDMRKAEKPRAQRLSGWKKTWTR